MKKFIAIAILAFIAHPTLGQAEEIKVDIAVGCPTIEKLNIYHKTALKKNGLASLSVAANLGCHMMLKGDQVEVLEYKILKNLVRVFPEGNTMTFWLPSEFVTTK